MMAKIDKFLVAEFQERGYDFDYKTLTEIYRASRKRTDCLAKKISNDNENAALAKIEEKMIKMGMK